MEGGGFNFGSVLSGLKDLSSSASKAQKTANTVNKVVYISMLIIAMILIAVSISQFAAYNWVTAIILLLFGGGLGYLGYTLMPSSE